MTRKGVSIESLSSDHEAIVEQSLMHLDPVSSSEVLDEEGDSDLHILMVDPDPPLLETAIIMGETDLSCAIAELESLTPFASKISTEELDSLVKRIKPIYADNSKNGPIFMKLHIHSQREGRRSYMKLHRSM